MIRTLVFVFLLLLARTSSAGERFWTVLVFMAGDNDLSTYAMLDFSEMERQVLGEKNLGTSTEELAVVAEVDTEGDSGIRRLEITQHRGAEIFDPFRFQNFLNLSEDELLSNVLLHEPENGSYGRLPVEERLRDFVAWGLHTYPARHTMLVIWGHGQGYIGDITYPDQKPFGGVAFDQSDKSYLSIPAIRRILENEKREGKKIDIMAFDACLMQSIEVATELKDVADILVGSVQIQDYVGLPYRSIIDEINHAPDMSPWHLAKKMVELTGKSYAPSGYQFGQAPKAQKTFTLSAIQLDEMKFRLLPSLERFKIAFANYLNEEPFRRFDISNMHENTPKFTGETRELGMYLGALKRLLRQEAQNHDWDYSVAALILLESIDQTLDELHRSLIDYTYGDAYIIDPGLHSPQLQYLLGFFKGISFRPPALDAF